MYLKAFLFREAQNLNGGVGNVSKQSLLFMYHRRLNTLAAEAASEIVLLRKAGVKYVALIDRMHTEGGNNRWK